MQKEILIQARIILICGLIFVAELVSAETNDCASDPATTQKKITHILRSLSCSQAKSLGDCEKAAGVDPLAVAETAGAAAILKTAQRYRSLNIAACKFSMNTDKPPLWFLNLAEMFFEAPVYAASSQACQRTYADNLLKLSSSTAAQEAAAAIQRQTEEISTQKQRITELREASEKSKNTALKFKTIEMDYFSTDNALKESSNQIQENRTKVADLREELARTSKTSQRYSFLEGQIKELTQKYSVLLQKLSERKRAVPPSESMRAILQKASEEKSKAATELSSLEKKLGGNLDSHLLVLEAQEARLKELKTAEAAYRNVVQNHKIGNPAKLEQSKEAVRSVGAMSDKHALSIRHVESLLNIAEQNELIASQRVAQGMASANIVARATASRAMTTLTSRAFLETGIKIIGGVVAAAGSLAAAAAEVVLYTSEPSDDACFDDAPTRNKIARMTYFEKAKDCKPTAEIRDLNEFRKILELDSKGQMEYFKNRYFCEWLDDVYQVHSPKISEVTCSAGGVSYSTENGQHIRASWNDHGGLSRYDSYGDSQSTQDHMYSIYFEDGTPKTLGFTNVKQQYATKRNFGARGFNKENQYQLQYKGDRSLASIYQELTNVYRTSFSLQALTLTEIKSCCRADVPRVEDETCYKKYGLKTNNMPTTTPKMKEPSTAKQIR